MPVNVGEAEIAALEAVSEALVVDAQQVKHGSVQIVHGSQVFLGGVSKFIGPSINGTSLIPPPAKKMEKPLM